MEIKLKYFVPAIQIAGQVRIRCKDIYVNLFDLPFSNGFDRYGCFQTLFTHSNHGEKWAIWCI